MDFLHLTLDKLSVDDILQKVSSEKCGAVSMFIGTTRDNFDGKKVVQLEYEAYEPMAIKVMKNMCGDIRKKWTDVHNIAIYHRLGVVPVMESSVVIAISSPHRVESMAAVTYCIENLKGSDLNIFPEEQPVTENYDYLINSQNVQVTASNDEINRRIKKFIERKREQINVSNIQDFITHNTEIKEGTDPEHSTCARVDAVLVRQKDSKGHLKVLRVQNEWGPQTKIEKVVHMKQEVNKNSDVKFNSGVEERITNAEIHLNLPKPISSDIYSRLKKIEEKILDLETISPEYFSFWPKNNDHKQMQQNITSEPSTSHRKYFSSDAIKEKIEALRTAHLK